MHLKEIPADVIKFASHNKVILIGGAALLVIGYFVLNRPVAQSAPSADDGLSSMYAGYAPTAFGGPGGGNATSGGSTDISAAAIALEQQRADNDFNFEMASLGVTQHIADANTLAALASTDATNYATTARVAQSLISKDGSIALTGSVNGFDFDVLQLTGDKKANNTISQSIGTFNTPSQFTSQVRPSPVSSVAVPSTASQIVTAAAPIGHVANQAATVISNSLTANPGTFAKAA